MNPEHLGWLRCLIVAYETEHRWRRDEDPSATREMLSECREWLAGMALQGLLAHPGQKLRDCAIDAVAAADYLLIELEENPWTAKPGT